MIYAAFGLGLASNQAIPRLAGAPAALQADVRIELNARPAWFRESSPSRVVNVSPFLDAAGAPMRTLAEIDRGWFRLTYVDGTDFLLEPHGREIWATWPAGMTVDDASSYLLGPVMGFLLRLRNRVCLHASGIVAEGRAFALVGPPGAGKSTSAAAFAARGQTLLSDDIFPLVETEDGFETLPGYPRVRLWPSALEAIGAIDHSVPTLPPDWGERRYHLDVNKHGYRFQTDAVPVGAIYVFRERRDASDTPRVDELSGQERLMALIGNSFAASLLDRKRRADDLEVLSRLSERVPVRAVTAHVNSKYLERFCDVVLADFMSISQDAGLALQSP